MCAEPVPQRKWEGHDVLVAVLDEHVVVRYGIELLIKNSPGFAWTGAASAPAELLSLIASEPCHVVLLDYRLSPGDLDGWNLVCHLRAHFPHIRILVYTAYESLAVAALMQRAGAHGFVLKSTCFETLLGGVRRVASGTSVFPSRCSLNPMSYGQSDAVPALSPREREVMRCCRQGMSVTAIAAKFHRSVKTISAQKQAAFRKLGVRTPHDFLLMSFGAQPDVTGCTP